MARTTEDILRRACDYPYRFPKESFLFDAANPSQPREFDTYYTKGRTPVLAFGSNQSPLRLAQKFGHEVHHIIPVERAKLTDFDVVYSAHITSYGAVPAMLQYSPGTIVDVAITWLDDVQLEMMHETEIAAANYHFAVLENLILTHTDTSTSDIAYAYIGTRGQLTKDGVGIALSAIDCAKRISYAMTTAEALNFIYTQTKPVMPFDEFILTLVDDGDYRSGITESLSASALPFGYDYRIIK